MHLTFTIKTAWYMVSVVCYAGEDLISFHVRLSSWSEGQFQSFTIGISVKLCYPNAWHWDVMNQRLSVLYWYTLMLDILRFCALSQDFYPVQTYEFLLRSIPDEVNFTFVLCHIWRGWYAILLWKCTSKLIDVKKSKLQHVTIEYEMKVEFQIDKGWFSIVNFSRHKSLNHEKMVHLPPGMKHLSSQKILLHAEHHMAILPICIIHFFGPLSWSW